MQHERDGAVAARDRGDGTFRVRRFGRMAVGVDELPGVTLWIQNVDAGVAQRRRERVAQHPRPRRLSEVVGQARQARPGPRHTEDGPGEAEREQGVRERPGDEDRGEPGAVRVLERSSQQGDRVRRFARADEQRRTDDREHGSATGTGRPGQPPPGEADQSQPYGERRPQQRLVECARDSGIGMDEERVVRAVAPAVEIEQRIAEERAGHGHAADDHVSGHDPHPRCRGTHAPVGSGECHMEDEYERERRDDGAEGAEYRSGALRPLPVRPEPREPGQQREHAEVPRARLGRRERACREQSDTGRKVCHPSGGERGGVGGPRAVIDADERGDGPCERERRPCEHRQAESGVEARFRHRAIFPPAALLPATVSAEKILWPAAMCRAPGDLTVHSCPREE